MGKLSGTGSKSIFDAHYFNRGFPNLQADRDEFRCLRRRGEEPPKLPLLLLRLTLVALLFFLASSVVAQDSGEAKTHASRGIALARVKDYGPAEEELKVAIQMEPNVAIYHAQLGSVLGLQAKWDAALLEFERAVALEPQNIGFRREAAAVQWQVGSLDAAERNLGYVLKKLPNDPGATLLLGLVSEKRGDFPKAAELLNSQFELATAQPDRAVALLRADILSGQKTSLPKIIQVFESHGNDESWLDAIRRSTQIAASAGDLQTTDALFRLIPESDPHRTEMAIQLAVVRCHHSQIEQAEGLFEALIDHGLTRADAQVLLGNCFEWLHQTERARVAYQTAIELDPSNISRYGDLMSLEFELGRNNEATALANRAISVAPNDARAWVWKGNAELLNNSYNSATASYETAARLDEHNADALLGLAAVKLLSGLSDAAIEIYKIGIQKFPGDSRFYIACAEAMRVSPQSVELAGSAEALLKKAIALEPNSAEAHYQLGQLALQQGRLTAAESEFLASLSANPNQSKVHFGLALAYRRTGRASEATKEFALFEEMKKKEDQEPTAVPTPAGKP
jgi:tetratricopeptide (TPR) repeat protein